MTSEVELVVASDTRWLQLIRGVVEKFSARAGLDPKATQEVVLAVDEAVANVIKHSYKGAPDQKISLRCENVEGDVEVEVRDQGEPFDPAERELPPPDELRVGGRGVYLIRSVMDEVEYRRDGSTNCVRMRKRHQTHVS